MKINSRDELNEILKKQSKKNVEMYALATYKGATKAVYFPEFPANGKATKDYFEAECHLNKIEFKDQSDDALKAYVMDNFIEDFQAEGLDYVKSMIRGNFICEITSYLTQPFLPRVIDNLEFIDEKTCVDFLFEK
ncbi:MAG: hypothetical protein RSD85_03070 [Erysipelotrichaceae bacterium]